VPSASTDLIATCWTSAGNVAPLWSSERSPIPVDERVRAVAETGWAGFGISQDDLLAVRETIGFAGLRKLIQDSGLRYTEVEILNHWWLPEGDPLSPRAVEELLFDAAHDLRASHIKIATAFGEPMSSIDDLVQPLKELARRAEVRGVRLAVETMPFSMLPTVPMGVELVQAVDNPACGLVVDSWHVFRAGTTLEELEKCLYPDILFGVELDDATDEIGGSLFEDTINNRRLCGQGAFPLVDFVATMRAVGYDGPWGVEIISDEHRSRPLREALEVARTTALDVVRPHA
jgi:sugar phosphate isomerase/epimerase